ncbi:MAG: hypothetical protein Q8O92_10100 [Candidatus Latescibacter sp.]|nr:hypothetical protein [Candidatus Latescibacter sp.]
MGSGNLKRCPYCAEFIQGAAIVCRFCGRDLPKENNHANSSFAESMGYFTGHCIARWGFGVCFAVIAGIFILFLILVGNFKSNTPPRLPQNSISSVHAPVSTPAPTPTNQTPVSTMKYDPVAKYGKEKVDAANKVMNLVKQDCNVFVDGGLVVEMSRYINDKNDLLGYVTAIANADAILFGSARSIFVYDPSKKLIASADAFRGIRLRD